MDLGIQPNVLKIRTNIEEMLIARVNPVLQVTHARGGQYKYTGHTISFPQEISSIARLLPRKLEDLELVIIHRTNLQGNNYECYANKNNVLNALHYKIRNDPYYKDIEIDHDALNLLPETTTDISYMIKNLPIQCQNSQATNDNETTLTDDMDLQHTTSFIPKLPNGERELHTIKTLLGFTTNQPEILPWPEIYNSPINEYNTEGLLTMAFPTLFPTGCALPLQTRTKLVFMNEYALQLLRYYDNKYGKHRFHYYIYNLIM